MNEWLSMSKEKVYIGWLIVSDAGIRTGKDIFTQVMTTNYSRPRDIKP